MTESAPWSAFEDVVMEIVGPVTDKTVEAVAIETARIEKLIDEITSSMLRVENTATNQKKSIKSLEGKIADVAADLVDIRTAVSEAAREEAQRVSEMQSAVDQLRQYVAHLAQQVQANTARVALDQQRAAETNAQIARIAERIDALEASARGRAELNLRATNDLQLSIESKLEAQRRLLYVVIFLIGLVLIAALVTASSLA